MTTGIIVQARMLSDRLPGKVLMEVEEKPLLAYLVERLKRSTECTKLVVATSTSPANDVIEELCQSLDVPCYRGSEQNVLQRYLKAAQLHHIETIVRITADCPLMDPTLIDSMVTSFREHPPPLHYLSNVHPRTYPHGMDIEVFTREALKRADDRSRDPRDREHVTPYLYNQMAGDGVDHVRLEAEDHSHIRVTVDYPEDFNLISAILKELYPSNPFFGWQDVVAALDAHPEWR
jgi:spore coat polysaccharide biosynthesis protein SpsF